MKEIYINIDESNNQGIITKQNNNNAEVYKLYILFNKRRVNLTGKTVKMGYKISDVAEGDILTLNITNAEQGEITLPITNKLTRKNGFYCCQLAIYGQDDYLEHTATFTLSVEKNIFSQIVEGIEDNKDLTYIENILEQAKKISGELKTNIPVANNLNSSLESNINNANNINSTLADTTEKSKVAATEAIQKKSDLESSIVEAKNFIDGLDGSQNIPGIRMELTELQNGLKSNQALAYQGSSISANDTLEGRTEGMRIKGRTLKNIIRIDGVDFPLTVNANGTEVVAFEYTSKLYKPNTQYYIVLKVKSNTLNSNIGLTGWNFAKGEAPITLNSGESGYIVKSFTTKNEVYEKTRCYLFQENTSGSISIDWFMILEENPNFEIQKGFLGIESFGEAEQEGDKYKISILSHGKNFVDFNAQIQDRNGTTHKILPNGIQVTSPSDNRQYWCHSALRVKLKKNTNYYCSFKYKTQAPGIGWIAIRTINDTLIKDLILNNGSFNSGDNDEIDVQFYASLGSPTVNNTVEYYDFQIEEGTIPTLSEPYIKDKKDILIKEPLKGIGDIKDVLYEDNGQVKINRFASKYTFTGDENWIKSGQDGVNTILFYMAKTDIKKGTKNIICSSFITKTGIWNPSTDFDGISMDEGNNIMIRIDKSKLSTLDVEGFKAWLKANPTIIVYQLATPTVEVVENCVDIDLDTYQDKTYFNILNSLPGTLDFKVPSNIGSVVQNMAKEVNNIWDVINNLLVPSLIETNKNIAMATIKNNL